MASPKRHDHAAVASIADGRSALTRQRATLGLFATIRVIERLARRARVRGVAGAPQMIGHDALPNAESVRLSASLRPSVPAGEVEALELAPGSGPPRLTTPVLGLTGPAGALPPALAELALSRARGRDRTLAAFFDLFNHRTLSLFYRTWEKYRVQHLVEAADVPGTDTVSRALDALTGVAEPGQQAALGSFAQTPRTFAGLLSRQVRPLGGLESALAALLGQRVRIAPFQLRWLDIAPAEQSRLSAAGHFNQLGVTAMLGSAVLDAGSRFEIQVGPLDRAAFDQLTRAGGALEDAFKLARLAAGPARDFGLRVIFKKGAIPFPVVATAGQLRLGYDFWLKTRQHESDRADVLLRPDPWWLPAREAG